jgi:hypothetical protein
MISMSDEPDVFPAATEPNRGLVRYPVPLRGGTILALVYLPADLTAAEAAKLAAFITLLPLAEAQSPKIAAAGSPSTKGVRDDPAR